MSTTLMQKDLRRSIQVVNLFNKVWGKGVHQRTSLQNLRSPKLSAFLQVQLHCWCSLLGEMEPNTIRILVSIQSLRAKVMGPKEKAASVLLTSLYRIWYVITFAIGGSSSRFVRVPRDMGPRHGSS